MNPVQTEPKKEGEKETTWLMKLGNESNSSIINLTETSNISAGYFHWLTEEEIYFYQEMEGGNIYKGILKGRFFGLLNFNCF